jgi:uncharacterized coiled-coil DUF342 family protein
MPPNNDELRQQAQDFTDKAGSLNAEAEDLHARTEAALAELEANREEMTYKKYQGKLVTIKANFKRVEKLRSKADHYAREAGRALAKIRN